MHRRLVAPIINQFSVNAHIPIFNENIRKIVSVLPLNGEFFDIKPFLIQCKLTMFAEAAFGTNLMPEAKQRYLRKLSAYVFLPMYKTQSTLCIASECNAISVSSRRSN